MLGFTIWFYHAYYKDFLQSNRIILTENEEKIIT